MAQFGGLGISLKKKPAATPSTDPASTTATSAKSTGCDTPKKKKSSALLGQVMGNVGGNVLGRTGISRFVPVSAFSSLISDAIACRLDEKEQKQAANATTEVTRGEKVGKTVEWTSDTRKDVKGKSTVTQQIASADGTKCMMVADVIIVNGEETRVDKKMCRAKGASGYTLSA
jgi:surface antigen